MKQKNLLLLFTFLLAHIPNSSMRAQENTENLDTFVVQVPTANGKLPMAFHRNKDNSYLAVGYQKYNRPAIPIETEGEIIIPDSVYAPDGQCMQVRYISQGSFQCCENITKVVMPYSIHSVSDLAFQGCKSLREIFFSKGLFIIYPRAFLGCHALKRINFRASRVPKIYPDRMFEDNIFKTATLTFPAAVADRYLREEVFSRFRYHAEIIPSYPKQQP